MRRYGKWVLTLGIVAVAPGLAAAASFPWQSNDTDTSSTAATQKSKNQKVAENIALALKKSAFHGYEIDIEYKNGLATLRGKVSDPRQKARASQVVGQSAGSAASRKQAGRRLGSSTVQSVRSLPREPTWRAARNRPRVSRHRCRPNQEKAMQIGHALQEAGLNGYDIEIMYQNGQLRASRRGWHARTACGACRVARSVPGVQAVSNQLRLQGQAGPQGDPRYAMAGLSDSGGSSRRASGSADGWATGRSSGHAAGSRLRSAHAGWHAADGCTHAGDGSGTAVERSGLRQSESAAICLALVRPVSQLCRGDLSQPVQRQCLALHRTLLPVSAGSPELAESDSGMV